MKGNKTYFYLISIIFILSVLQLAGCGKEKNVYMEETKIESESQNIEDETIESPFAAPTPKPKENAEPESEEISGIYGKWKILDMAGHGYIYGEFSMEDYVGGVVTIAEDYMECDLPMGKSKLENPKYKLTTQSRNEFLEGRKVTVDNIFGFKPDKIQMIEVIYDYDDIWDGFVRFWIRDETHLIFLGPVYFLAEKAE